jgi:hypothetical protein
VAAWNDIEPVHPALSDARQIPLLEDAIRAQRDPHLDRLGKAVLLAPNLRICEALLRGEKVPYSRLDLDAANRYRLR